VADERDRLAGADGERDAAQRAAAQVADGQDTV
jgi:hypothetical protein